MTAGWMGYGGCGNATWIDYAPAIAAHPDRL
jgi:hypothetical protein